MSTRHVPLQDSHLQALLRFFVCTLFVHSILQSSIAHTTLVGRACRTFYLPRGVHPYWTRYLDEAKAKPSQKHVRVADPWTKGASSTSLPTPSTAGGRQLAEPEPEAYASSRPLDSGGVDSQELRLVSGRLEARIVNHGQGPLSGLSIFWTGCTSSLP